MNSASGIRRTSFAIGILLTGALAVWSRADEPKPRVAPVGEEKSANTKLLEMGAKVLQTNAPLKDMDIYLVGFHPMKDDPAHQMEAHHFCRQVNKDFAQCALFDSNTKEANLNGIEYIISEKVFTSLPQEEQHYWHPHNYEILSGQLVAPGIPEVAEKALMKKKMNSYGKTWHVWNTGSMGAGADKLPLGQPKLAWSFNHDGEAKPGLVEQRDEKMDMHTSELRKDRQDLATLAQPQAGVDALKKQFPGPTQTIAGVRDKDAPAQEEATTP
jgi:hypothetical protein